MQNLVLHHWNSKVNVKNKFQKWNILLKGSLPEGVGEGLIEPPLDFWPIWLKAWASGDLGSKCRSAVQIVSNKNFLRKNQTSNIFNFHSWKLRDNRYTNKVKLADLDALFFPFKMCYCLVMNEKSRKVWSTWLVDHSLHSKWNVTLFCSLWKMKGLIMLSSNNER